MGESIDFVDKAYGCLLGGLIGDAMGTPTEGREPAVIEEQFGWVEDFEGDGTDDSILKYLLCDALIKTGGYATSDDWAATWIGNRGDITGPKRNKFFVSVQHTLTKLLLGYLPRTVSIGNMASSSSAMSIAPVGIVNAGHPRMASAQAQELGSLIHTGDVSFCQDGAATIAAAVAAGFCENATIDTVLEAATGHLKPTSGAEVHDLIEAALELARETQNFADFRDAYHARFRKPLLCDARETVPATMAICYLAKGNPRDAVIYGANFGRDTDTIATMAGGVCGALGGSGELPPAWIEKTASNSFGDQLELARTLVGVARSKSESEIAAWGPVSREASPGSDQSGAG